METAELGLGGVVGGEGIQGAERGRSGGGGEPRRENSQFVKYNSVAQKVDWDARDFIVIQVPTITSQSQHKGRGGQE